MTQASPASQRVHSLDSLRGVAALIVVFHHCALAIPGFRESLYDSYFARPLIIGPSAVYVFFVLSGMVLYGALSENGKFQYLPYLVKRIFRIFPPLCAAILLSVVLYWIIRPHQVEGASEWFNRSWSQSPSFNLIAGHLLFWDPWKYSSFDNVIWSLVHEMRVSFVFPLLVLALRTRLWLTILISLALFVETSWTISVGYSNGLIDLARTLHYLPLFVGGALVMMVRESFARLFSTPANELLGLVGLIAGIILLCIEDSDACMAAGAMVTVLACSSVPTAERLLCYKWLLPLGRISYSLYLAHLIVLLTLIHGLAGTLPLPVLCVLAVLLSPLVAVAVYRLVEEPARLAGRRLSKALTSRERLRLMSERDISRESVTRIA